MSRNQLLQLRPNGVGGTRRSAVISVLDLLQYWVVSMPAFLQARGPIMPCHRKAFLFRIVSLNRTAFRQLTALAGDMGPRAPALRHLRPAEDMLSLQFISSTARWPQVLSSCAAGCPMCTGLIKSGATPLCRLYLCCSASDCLSIP
jgi:hypothetical protein